VKRRLKALKRLQAEANKVESRFYEEVHEIERKYMAQYEPFFQRVRFLRGCLIQLQWTWIEWMFSTETTAMVEL